MRRYGTPRRFDVKYTMRPGAYGIISHGQDLLLTLQVLEKAEIQLPGGGIDAGETPIQALHREVFEETGYHIKVRKRLGAFQRFTYMPEYDIWAQKVCHIYLCGPARMISEPKEPNHTALWMNAIEAQSVLGNPGDAAFVAQVFGIA